MPLCFCNSLTQFNPYVFAPFQSKALVLSLKKITLGEPVFPHVHSETQQNITISKTSEITFSLSAITKWQPQPRIPYPCIVQAWKQTAMGFAECLQSWEEIFYQILHKSRNEALGPGSHMIQQMLFPASASFHSEATASMFNSAPWITYKILLACINERPNLELQQKYNTQLLTGWAKNLHYHHFPLSSQRGANVCFMMVLHEKHQATVVSPNSQKLVSYLL